MPGDGIVSFESRYGVTETIDRLAAAVAAHGLTVFARIDHAQGAADVGLVLRPTELLIFGNARGGTPLMQDNQAAGLDLPLKALAWQDAAGTVWLSANDTRWIASRHGLGSQSGPAVTAIDAGLRQLMRHATGAGE